MAEVIVRIAERSFRLACDDGQEPRLQSMAEAFQKRVVTVQDQNLGIGDVQAIVVAALAVMDEFDEARHHWSGLTPEGEAAEWVADRLDEASLRLEKALASLA